jgi:hypothetical protein
MAKQTHSFILGVKTFEIPGNLPDGCPDSIEIDLGVRFVSWDIPDEPTSNPNWPAFRDAIEHSDALMRIANVNPARFVLVNAAMWQIASDPSKAIETATNWNLLAAEALPTESEIAELNGIAQDNNVPFQLNAQGLMG